MLTTVLILTTMSVADDSTIEKAIHQVLTVQSKAWNEGNIKAFMEHYWKSKKLTFSAGGETTRGWKATLERYQKKYPNRAKMGKLTFSNLEVTKLSDAAALVLGRWKLKRAKDTLGGNFSLIFRKIERRWLIIHDHTSSSPR